MSKTIYRAGLSTAATAVLAILAAAPAVGAETLTLDLTGAASADRTTIQYQCEGIGRLAVEYVNAGPNSLALVPVEGDMLVFVAVVAGSGARYVSGPYTWWASGRSANLSNLFEGEDTEPVSCQEVGEP